MFRVLIGVSLFCSGHATTHSHIRVISGRYDLHNGMFSVFWKRQSLDNTIISFRYLVISHRKENKVLMDHRFASFAA